MESLSLTQPYAVSGRGRPLALGASAGLTISGMVLALLLQVLWPLALSAAAGVLCAWLLHTQPLLRHVEYLSLNEDGLRYVHTPGAGGRVSHHKWTELRAVTAELARDGAPRLVLRTGRGAATGAVLALPMPSDADCLAAQAAAQRWLAAYRV